MRYLLIDKERRYNALEFVRQTPVAVGWCVEIKPYKRNRTLNQNNTCHNWLQHIAQDQGVTMEDIKTNVKIASGFYNNVMNGGKVYTVIRSTADFSVEEMTKYMNALLELAENLNIKLPMPDDLTELQYGYNSKGNEYA